MKRLNGNIAIFLEEMKKVDFLIKLLHLGDFNCLFIYFFFLRNETFTKKNLLSKFASVEFDSFLEAFN